MVLPDPLSSTAILMRPGAKGAVGQTHGDGHIFRRAVAGGGRGNADHHDLNGIDAAGIRSGAVHWVAVEVRNGIGARGAGDAHVDVAGCTAAVGRAGDIGLIPFDHDGHVLARNQRGYGHRQRRDRRGAGRIEVQQVLARIRSAAAHRRRGELRRDILVGQRAIVARGRKIGHTLSVHGIDGLRHDAVLIEGLIEITHVVGNHPGPGRGQPADAGGEIRLAVLRRIEGQTRARRHIVHHLQHGAALIAEGQLGGVAVVMTAAHARRLREHIDRGGQIAAGHIRGRRREKTVRGIARVARGRHAVRRENRIAIVTVGDHADRDSRTRERIVRAHQVAALHVVALGGHRAAARARQGGTNTMYLGTRSRRLQLGHRQPAADVIRVHGGVLQAQCDQRGFQLRRVAAGDRIDEHQRRGIRRGLSEMYGGSQRPQVLQGVIGARQGRVARQIRERRVILRAGRTVPLLRAAAAEGVQMCAAGQHPRP